MIKAEINRADLIKTIDKFTPKVKAKLKKIVAISGVEWQSYVRKEFFTGYAYGKRSDKLQSRTGFLKKSIHPAPVKETSQGIEGGLNFGASYAKVHVGPRGRVTTFSGDPYLKIPLEEALTGKGELRAHASDESMWGNTYIQKSKKGNLILFGQRLFQKGKSTGEAATDIVPLFLLRKQVKIKTRIHPEQIFAWAKDKIVENIQKELV